MQDCSIMRVRTLYIFTTLLITSLIGIPFLKYDIYAQNTTHNLSDTTINSKMNTNDDQLPSWKDGLAKQNIVSFVKNITDSNNIKYFIPIENRIAVFDNDGTLWSEKPIPFQGFFLYDRFKELSAKNPDLILNPKFEKLAKGNLTVMRDLNEKDVMELGMITHSNISQTEFNNLVSEWSQTATHPTTGKKFVDMVYQPMLELIDLLKTNQFKVFIVSGGGVDFMREALSSVYGIPPEQIIGSSIKYEYIDQINANESKNVDYNGTSFILRKAELSTFNNDYQKPANIQLHIGKVPVIAVGNSDGDLQMLEYVADNNQQGKSLSVLVHHDDGAREFLYDEGAENVLKDAQERNWTMVSMKNDFKIIFPSELSSSNK